jgi:hypothetical protein
MKLTPPPTELAAFVSQLNAFIQPMRNRRCAPSFSQKAGRLARKTEPSRWHCHGVIFKAFHEACADREGFPPLEFTGLSGGRIVGSRSRPADARLWPLRPGFPVRTHAPGLFGMSKFGKKCPFFVPHSPRSARGMMQCSPSSKQHHHPKLFSLMSTDTTKRFRMLIPASAAVCLMGLCLGTMNAGEPGGTVILSEDFNGLSEGPVAGQDQWAAFPRAVSPAAILLQRKGEAPGLALSAPLDIGELELSAALRPLANPLDGTETLVIEYDVLRRAGDSLQVGLAKGGIILPGLDIAGGGFAIRSKALQVAATSTPVPGESEALLKYGHWYRVRATWNAEKGTVRVEYKDLSAGEESFQTAYFDADRKNPDYQNDMLGFEGADTLFVRMPSAKSIKEARADNAAAEPSVLDNISLSK